MDFNNLFSFGTLMYFGAAFLGALIHFARQTEYKVTLESVKGWALGDSFLKSCAVIVCIAGIAVSARIIGVHGFLGFFLVGVCGYFADSIFKRMPDSIKQFVRHYGD